LKHFSASRWNTCRRYLEDRKESHNRGTIADLNYQPANSLLGSIAYQKENSQQHE
jgi:hypothetical protein